MFTVKVEKFDSSRNNDETTIFEAKFTHPDEAAESFVENMARRFDDTAYVFLYVLNDLRWEYGLANEPTDEFRWWFKFPLFGGYPRPEKPLFLPLPELLKKYDVSREAWRWWSSAAGDAKPKLRKYFHYYRTSKCTFVDEEAFATLAAKKPLSLWK